MMSAKVMNNNLNTWALEGQGLVYQNGTKVLTQGLHLPAIIDTGSSQLAVPPAVFDSLLA